MSETRTLQAWPNGRTFTFSGDYHGPGYTVHEDGTARPATTEEARDIRRNELACIYADRDILCCDSSLVDALLQADFDGFSVDDIENVYADPSDWSVEQCRDYIDEHGSDSDYPSRAPNPWGMDRSEIIEALTEISIDCRDDETDDTLRAALIANIDDETADGLDDWREAARELSNDNPREAYEWWRVSSWLCGQLRDIGEIVIDNDYGYWWGRTCTGQGYLMDGTLQAVADRSIDR